MEQTIQEQWDNDKRYNICDVRLPEGGEKKERGREEILEAIMI